MVLDLELSLIIGNFFNFIFRKVKRNRIFSCMLCCIILKEKKKMILILGMI